MALVCIVEREKRLLVCGPFASGKTALVQLLHFHLGRVNKTAYAITLSGSYGSWQEWWLNQMKVPWNAIANSSESVFILIDEVQQSYSDTSSTHNLWGCIKNTHASATELQNVHFVCFGAYGSRTQTVSPDSFGEKAFVSLRPHNGTPGIAYTPEEFQALCKVVLSVPFLQLILFANSKMQLFAAKMSGPQDPFEIDERSANYIFHMAGGHPGIIGFFLVKVSENIKNYRSKGITTFCTDLV